MGTNRSSAKPALGFLTVLEDPQHGLFGGYLLLNLAGRPLEFHCTTPIKPNRAQEILYGPTLESFLYGEQIGYTLVGEAKTEPLVICTDREQALAVRPLIAPPVVLVLRPEDVDTDAAAGESVPKTPVEPLGQRKFRLDSAHPAGPRLVTFSLGRNRLGVPQRSEDDRQRITERLADLDESFDLAEPFLRIRQAIEEAQQAVR
jgi:hypothetical protein